MPDAGADSSMRPGPSSRKQQPDPTEVRLANAEKQIAIALETSAYDELIGVATEALNFKHGQPHVPPSKAIIKSRKTLLWARSKAYYHQDRHDQALKDAKAALKLDPNDVAAYVRAAVLLGSSGHKAQAFSCLDTAQSLSFKFEPATRALWLRKIDKQRRKVSGASWLTDRLPSEIMIEIASHLDVVGRNSMSQTCRSWRHILVSAPRLWTSLSIKTITKALNANKASDLLHYIHMRAERAKHSLESVVFQDSFPPTFFAEVVKILRASANTLKQLHIPAHRNRQRLLYLQLYRFCPQLKRLTYLERLSIPMPDFKVDSTFTLPATKDESGATLSQLEDFECLHSFGNGIHGPSFELYDHLRQPRILKGYNPFRVHLERGSFKFDDEQMASSILEHLEEWQYWDFCGTERLGHHQPCPASFAKLTKLTRFVVGGVRVLEFTFPSLLELQIRWVAPEAEAARELIRLLRTSPKLCSLSLGPRVELELDSVQNADFCQALLRLQSLKRLDWGVRRCETNIAELLLPRAGASASGGLEATMPLPLLDTVLVNAGHTDLNKLAISLLVREHLRTGQTLTAARQTASDRLSMLPKKQTTASPFQRGSTSAADTSASSLGIIQDAYLDEPSNCSRLKRLELTNVVQVPDNIKSAFESVCDEVTIEYTQL